jgi:hypothetical protein
VADLLAKNVISDTGYRGTGEYRPQEPYLRGTWAVHMSRFIDGWLTDQLNSKADRSHDHCPAGFERRTVDTTVGGQFDSDPERDFGLVVQCVCVDPDSFLELDPAKAGAITR